MSRYLEFNVVVIDARPLDEVATALGQALDVAFERVVAEGFPSRRDQDRYEGRTLGMRLLLHAGDPEPGGTAYRLDAITRSGFRAGAEGPLEIDDAVLAVLRASGFDSAMDLATWRAS